MLVLGLTSAVTLTNPDGQNGQTSLRRWVAIEKHKKYCCNPFAMTDHHQPLLAMIEHTLVWWLVALVIRSETTEGFLSIEVDVLGNKLSTMVG